MKLTHKAYELIHRHEQRYQAMTPADKLLAKKYPRHTLEQAREIDGAKSPAVRGYSSGFEKIQAQERGCYHLGGSHT